MDFAALINLLLGLYPSLLLVLQVLGGLVVLGQAVVLMTPSKKDDEILAEAEKGILGSIMSAIKAFAVIQKK